MQLRAGDPVWVCARDGRKIAAEVIAVVTCVAHIARVHVFLPELETCASVGLNEVRPRLLPVR
jgi:hypothetical protein